MYTTFLFLSAGHERRTITTTPHPVHSAPQRGRGEGHLYDEIYNGEVSMTMKKTMNQKSSGWLAQVGRILIFTIILCTFLGMGWYQPTVAEAETLSAGLNTAITPTLPNKSDTAAYVVMQRFQLTSASGGTDDGKVTLTSLTLDDNTATAQYAAVRVYLSTTSTTTIPVNAIQIGRTTGIWTGATATTIPISSGTTTQRSVFTGAPAYVYIAYDMLAGQAPNTAQSRVTAVAVAAPDTILVQPTGNSNLITLSAGVNASITLCTQCHTNPPVDSATRNVATGLFVGSHNKHAVSLSLVCTVCHSNNVTTGHRTGYISMASPSIYGGNYSKATASPFSFPQTTNATTGTMGTCNNVTCHSTVQGANGVGAGANVPVVWATPGPLGCSVCHVDMSGASATGRHVKHTNSTAGNYNMPCSTCHTGYTSTSINLATHANNTIDVTLAIGSYNGGTTAGNHAPGGGYGTCSSNYCHSTVQSTNGQGPPATYMTPTWGGAGSLGCGGCHVDMKTNNPATGSHRMHAQTANITCDICHGTGYSATTVAVASHANGSINVTFTGNALSTNYSQSLLTAPSNSFGSCSTSNCHGGGVPFWGADTTYATCVKCHGIATSSTTSYTADTKRAAPGYYTASAPSGTGRDTGGATAATDAEVGAHNAHLNGASGISSPIVCTECHKDVLTTSTTFTGHMDGAGTIVFGTLASTTRTPSYSAPNCSNVYCHRANRPAGAAAGQGGLTTAASWTDTALLGNTSITDTCINKCHAMPPGAGISGDTHAGVATVGGTLTATVFQTCSTNGGGTGCHPDINLGSTTTVGALFFDNTLHINGTVNANGHLFPYTGASHSAAAGVSPWSSCSSCHNTGTTVQTYPVAVGTPPDCRVCHVSQLNATPTGTSSCIDCHGATNTNGEPVLASFPNTSNSHRGHNDTNRIALTCSNCHSGAGSGTATHGNSNRVAKTDATIAFSLGTMSTPIWTNVVGTTSTGSCSVACHRVATWGAQLTCVSCHATAVYTSAHTRSLDPTVTSRPSITAEFGLAWGHKKASRGAVADADCIVCHLEGNFTTQQTSTYHANGYIDLRNPDGAGETAITNMTGGAFLFTRFSTTYAALSRSSTGTTSNNPDNVLTQKFCLACHDSNGATNTTARSNNGGTGSQYMPFGGISTGYAVINGAAAANGLIDVKTEFATTNSSFHPVVGPLNRDFPLPARLNAPYNNNVAGRLAAGAVKTNSVVLNCFDCHNAPTTPLLNRTVVSHGSTSANHLRGNIYSTTAPVLCTVCHATSYGTTVGGHGSGSAFSTMVSSGSSHTATTFGLCNNCHLSATTLPARPKPSQDIHGFNKLNNASATDLLWPTGTTESYRPFGFLRNTVQYTTTTAPRPFRVTGGVGAETALTTGAAVCGGAAVCDSHNMTTYTPGGSY